MPRHLLRFTGVGKPQLINVALVLDWLNLRADSIRVDGHQVEAHIYLDTIELSWSDLIDAESRVPRFRDVLPDSRVTDGDLKAITGPLAEYEQMLVEFRAAMVALFNETEHVASEGWTPDTETLLKASQRLAPENVRALRLTEICLAFAVGRMRPSNVSISEVPEVATTDLTEQ
jgi:hypothetical protein